MKLAKRQKDLARQDCEYFDGQSCSQIGNGKGFCSCIKMAKIFLKIRRKPKMKRV